MINTQIVVVGAGAGGLMAAGKAAESGVDVLLLEKMDQPGKKLLLSGKTRCNLTNAGELEDFIQAYGTNGKFLYSAFSRFFRDDLLILLKRYGVETKIERGGRIFPVSDQAVDVLRALIEYNRYHGVQLKTGVRVTGIEQRSGCVSDLNTNKGSIKAKAVILATGGASYPLTGTTGDGYLIAKELGHSLVPLRASLVPLVVEEVNLVRALQGISLKNVCLSAFACRAEDIENKGGKHKSFARLMGEMMMTHFGIGGPITLQMSMDIVDALQKGPVSVSVDLKPALIVKQLQQRLQRDFDNYGKRSLKRLLKELLPVKMIEPFIRLSGMPPEKPGNQINSEERDRIVDLMKGLRFNIKCPLPLSSAMVTAGGISLKEIDPRSMASKLIKGLYFCGEVLDIQAGTGGYNLQAAFSTGYLAGESASKHISQVVRKS